MKLLIATEHQELKEKKIIVLIDSKLSRLGIANEVFLSVTNHE